MYQQAQQVINKKNLRLQRAFMQHPYDNFIF